MKHTLIIAICLIFSLKESVLGATLSEIQLRRAAEENFMNTQISSTKSSIKQNIDNTKSTLNTKAEGIKSDIRKGPPSCYRWEELIVSLQTHQINFMYQFQPCEKNSELINLNGKTRSALQTMDRTIKNLLVICGFTNCQSQIDSVAYSLDVMHLNIVNEIARILGDSRSCVSSRGGSIDKQLDSNRQSWEKCT